ncbi:DUF6020 family protein [Butyrivibrio sp. VCD2006]|uniref:DUF6020 family protein n=1 Tax=Butyrivibrio sp. VCD2006 TaxID=1280664 RepID=UPI00040165E9|nr:DUF6020 family protein [Butyrivibrio sp. VCD2006]
MGKRDISIIICIISAILWVSFWDKNTDTFFQNYFLLGVVALAAGIYRYYLKTFRSDLSNILLSALFSLSVLLANYDNIYNVKQWICLFIFGVVVFENCIFLLEVIITKGHDANEYSKKEKLVWRIITFVSVAGVDFYYLLNVAWPGIATVDSIAMIGFFLSGNYTNHHPYYMIRYMKVLYDISMAIWGNINSFVALFSVIQVLVVSAFFVYFVDTMMKQKLSRVIIAVTIIGYTCLPYNIKYSVTMWKDIPFSLCLTGIMASFLRIIRCEEQENKFDYIMMFLCTLGVGILRNNGSYCLIVFVFALWIFRTHIKKKMLLVVIVSTVLGIFMNGPMLDLLNVKPTETIESLSIPIQQVARAVVDDGYISKEQKSELNHYLPVDKVRELYYERSSDPVKTLALETITDENIKDFLILWAKIGLKNPVCYFKAWVDQTKGFWCAGIPNNIWWKPMIVENSLGIQSRFPDSSETNPMEEYICSFTSKSSLRLFISIGLFIWIMFALILIHLKRKDYSYFVMCLPLIVLWGTLLIASPVNGEFRYIYSLFLAMPLLLFENGVAKE